VNTCFSQVIKSDRASDFEFPSIVLKHLSEGNNYQSVRPISESRMAIMQNGKWGFLNEQGQIVIQPEYDLAYDFKCQVTAVSKKGKWYLIRQNGELAGNLKGYQYIGAFFNGQFNCILDGENLVIDEEGRIIEHKGSLHSTSASFIQSPDRSRNSNVGCPPNLDYEFQDFTNWQCDTGEVRGPNNSVWGISTDGSNQIFNTANTSPLPNRHEIIINNINNSLDPYGGFSINPPDGSGACIKLGSDQNGGVDPSGIPWPNSKTESVTYYLNIPSGTTNLSFIYNFAVVLVEPFNIVHQINERPRFKVEIFDALTNQIVDCGKVEYVADSDSALAAGFSLSPLSNSAAKIWYKNWSQRFINLAKYAGGNPIKIRFSTADCTLGAHWGYAYLDIQGCQNFATVSTSCNQPLRTIMNGPPLFSSYEWYNHNYTVHYGSGRNFVYNAGLPVGDTVKLVVIPPALLFSTQICPDTVIAIVQGPANSIFYDAGPNRIMCQRQPISIGTASTNSNYVYSWSPSLGLSNNNQAVVTANPLSNITYTVIVTDTSSGCSKTDAVNIQVNPSPNLSVNISNACYNQKVTISVSGADTYLWTTSTINPPNAFTLTNGNPSVASFNTNSLGDTIKVSLGLNNSTCVVDTVMIIKGNPLPISDFFVPPPQCLTDNIFSLTSGSFVNPGTIATNHWLINNNQTIIGSEAIFSFATPGIFPVKLISTTDKGCSDSIIKNVEVRPMPIAVFKPSTFSTCLNANPFTFTDSSYVNTGSIVSYYWDFGDNRYSIAQSPTHNYLLPGSYNVKLVVTSDAGCTDTTTRAVNVLKLPNAYFAQPDSQCLIGNIFRFVSQSTISSPQSIANQIWSFNGNTFNSNQVTYSFTNPGTYRVKLVVTSNEGCKDSINQVLMVFPTPQADFNLQSGICFAENNILFSSNSSVSTGYIDSCFWNFGDGTTANVCSIRHPYTNASVLQYQIQLISQSDYGCRDTISKGFNFLESPDVTVNALSTTSLCSGDSVVLQAFPSTPSGLITSLQWQVGGVDIAGATTPFITVKTSGLYTIVVQNAIGCKATSQDLDVIVHPFPVANIVPPNNNYICEGGDKLLVCSGNASSYQWYLDGTAILGATAPTYLATLPGFYTISLVSDFGCKNSATGSFTLSTITKPVLSFDIPEYCILQPVVFVNNSDVSNSGLVNWLWNFGDGSTSSLVNPTHLYQDTGLYTVRLSVQFNNCPSFASDSAVVISVMDPIPGIRYNSINALPNTDIILHSRDFNMGVLWIPGTGLSDPVISSPVFNYDRDQEYLIRVRNISGCITVDTQLVRIFRSADIQVPTAFSPNGDGHNDLLDIFLIGIYKFKRFMVFNRWGQLLYETTDPRQLWDGRFKGKMQPVETYVWLAEGEDVKGLSVFRRGQTILMR